MERYKEIERSIIKKFRKDIWSKFVKAVKEYELISENDKVMVCISGGKDSFLLAKCIEELQRHGDVFFDTYYVVMDPGYSEKTKELIQKNADILNLQVEIFSSDIFDIVDRVDRSPCYLCARMRRGCLYKKAQEMGCNKIALGHHFDDVIETILMSMLYGAQVNTMMPKLHSTNFPGMELIRPLYLVKEEDILSWKEFNKLRFLQCACRFTEQIAREKALEEEVHSSKRQEIKELIKTLEKINPNIPKNIFRSVENVNLDACIEYVKKGKRYHFLETY